MIDMDELMVEPFYEIAEESFSLSKIKETVKNTVQNLIVKLRNFIQFITSKINKLLEKFFKVKTLTINQDLYNEVMGMIHSILNLDFSLWQNIKFDIAFIKKDYESIEKLYMDLLKKLKILDDIGNQVINMKEVYTSKTVVVKTSSLNNMRDRFNKMKQLALQQVTSFSILQNVVDKIMSDKETDNKIIQKLQENISLIMKLQSKTATIDMFKANLLLKLVYKLFSNDVTVQQPKVGIEMKPSLNSFIDFCDEYQIAEESLRGIKKLSNIKDIRERELEITKMPSKTKEEIKAKIEAYEDLTDECRDALAKLKDLKPDALDHLISTLSYVGSGAVAVGAGVQNAKISHNPYGVGYNAIAKLIGIGLGAGFIKAIISKGTVRSKKELLSSIKQEITKNISNYTKSIANLEQKMNYM